MTAPYSISLLNDLHYHFPDLLYRPNQFRNVPDVLNYIIGVANRNPYEEARQARDQQVQQAQQAQQARERQEQENPRIQPHNLNQVPTNELYRIMNRRAPRSDDLLSMILNDMVYPAQDPPSLQNFFLNPVESVRLTNAQMEQGTILTRSLQRQEDNCAICQDPIEAEQMMRIMRHCTHRFHQTCVDTWLTNHVSCPTCRHDIRQ